MGRSSTSETVAPKVVGRRPTKLGAKRVGRTIRINQEVTSREGSTPVVRFVTTTVESRPRAKPRKASDWMEDSRMPEQLLAAFRKAVSKAKSKQAT